MGDCMDSEDIKCVYCVFKKFLSNILVSEVNFSAFNYKSVSSGYFLTLQNKFAVAFYLKHISIPASLYGSGTDTRCKHSMVSSYIVLLVMTTVYR